MLKYKLFTLFCCCVYSVMSMTSFIENGQRAQIFELTDNEMAEVKITLPQDELALFKDTAYINGEKKMKKILKVYSALIKDMLNNLKGINFNYYFPNCDYNSIVPELKINEDGYPSFDVDEVFNGFNFDPKDYLDLDNNIILLVYTVFSSNDEFNLWNIFDNIYQLQLNEELEESARNDIIDFSSVIFEDLNLEELVIHDFKTKNASMIVNINGEQKQFNKLTFSLGGKYSRDFSKPGYNIKIRGDKDLYGRKHFKIRSDCNEPTYLRTKLISDIHNRLGIPSVSSNYIKLYINEEYMGLYLLNDAYKPSWINYVYGENDTKILYKCNNIPDLTKDFSEGCINEDEDVTDNTEWIKFLDAVENANSASDLEDIFEIDHFLTEIALEYLLGAWDHIQNAHNFYMYKQPNGKWIYLSHDFDHDFGINAEENQSFANYTKKLHIIDILILKDPKRFENILKDVVMKVFNPSILYPRIDELKAYIKPLVEIDKTPNAEGQYPGRINPRSDDLFTMEQWDANSEFTTIKTDAKAFGLKYWILSSYRNICKLYSLDCDKEYLDENYKYSVNKDIEYNEQLEYEELFNQFNITMPEDTLTAFTNKIATNPFTKPLPSNSNNSIKNNTITIQETLTTTIIPTSTVSIEITSEVTTPVSTVVATNDVEISPVTTTTTTTVTSTNEILPQYQCWAELLGYNCCAEGITKVYAQDTYGDWSYDFNKQEWCGLTTYEERPSESDECWSEELGYACCKGCHIIETDEIGAWGYESNHWCGIPTYCQE